MEYFELLATPWLCTMASTFAMEAGEYDAWARRMYPEAYAVRPNPKPPKLERLHVFCTGKDVVQSHRAMADVDMLCACLPDLMRRGWFRIPAIRAAVPQPLPNVMRVPMPKARRPTTRKTQKKVSRSAASKRTSASTPIRTYALRSRGPIPVLCL